MLRRIADVSGEGGPLLLADAMQIRAWSGAGGTDYARACAVFDDRHPEPPGGVLLVEGRAAIVWEMGGAGSAFVFEVDEGLLVVRAWVDDDTDIERLAALPMIDSVTIGSIEPIETLLLLWAAEDGRQLRVSAKLGTCPVGLNMAGSGLVVACDVARYKAMHDDVGLASGASARRLHLTSFAAQLRSSGPDRKNVRR